MGAPAFQESFGFVARSAGKGTLVGVRLQPTELDKLDAYRAQMSPEPSRPEAIRMILESNLSTKESKT